MNERGCCDQAIHGWARVGHMKCGAALRDRCINWQNATGESWQNMILQPTPENSTLRRIAALGPLRHIFISAAKANFPQLGDHIGIKKEHQDKSAGLARSRERGASKSISAIPGIASKSAIFW